VLAERSGNLLAGAGCLLEEAATVLPIFLYDGVCVCVLNVLPD
jgi:hypothetical protein